MFLNVFYNDKAIVINMRPMMIMEVQIYMSVDAVDQSTQVFMNMFIKI